MFPPEFPDFQLFNHYGWGLLYYSFSGIELAFTFYSFSVFPKEISDFSSSMNTSYPKLVGGFNHLEKYEFVSWDDDIPKYMESHSIHVPNHQPAISSYSHCCWFIAY